VNRCYQANHRKEIISYCKGNYVWVSRP